MICLLALLACGGGAPPPPPVDADLDGVMADLDCDDLDPAVYPGAPDPWYDGIDGNCDGADDYDRDGDGFAWAQHGGTDCNDDNDRVNPDGTEIPYDSLDNDCDTTTPDNDLDGDGSWWPFDCADDDPSVGEAFEERVGDGVDEDCDGNPDGTVLLPFDYAFAHPSELLWITWHGEPALALRANQVSGHVDGSQVDAEVGLFLRPTLGEAPLLFHGGLGGVDPLHGLDVATDGTTLWFGASLTTITGGQRLTLAPFEEVGSQLLRMATLAYDVPGDEPLPWVDLQLDRGDDPWLAAGSATTVAWFAGATEAGGSAPGDASGGVALIADEVPPLPFMACGEGGCERWETDHVDGPPVVSSTPPPLSTPASGVHHHDDVITLVDPDEGLLVLFDGQPYAAFQGVPLADADAVEVGGVLFAGAVAKDERVLLTYGSPEWGVLHTSEWTLDNPTYEPDEIAVWADDTRVVLAVSAHPTSPFDVLEDRVFWRIVPRARD